MFQADSGMLGFALSKPAFGTMKLFSSISAAFMIDTSPLAFSRWPMLDLTDPMCSGSRGVRAFAHGPVDGSCLDGVTDFSSGPVGFEKGNVFRVDPGLLEDGAY